MHSELGLLPVCILVQPLWSLSSHNGPQKPLRRYRRVVSHLQNMLDLLTGLRKIRENIPRKVTVTDVLNERREFVSDHLTA